MKHKKLILSGIFFMLLLSGCGSTKEQPAAEPEKAEPRIASVSTYNKTGKIQKKDFYSYDHLGQGHVSSYIAYSYNDIGRLTSAKKYTEGDEFGKPVENYVYSGDKWTQHIIYDEFSAASEVYNRTYYPSGGIKIEQVKKSFREGANLSGTDETCTYDENGILTQKDSVEGNVYTRSVYFYDEETGSLQKEEVYNSNTGKNRDYMLFNTVLYTYDEETGLLAKALETGLGGAVNTVTAYEYDAAGRKTYEAKYSSELMDDASFLSSSIYEYDEKGNCTLDADMNKDGSGWKTSYEYDASGNLIYEAQLTFYGDSETRSSTIETEYDDFHHPVRQTEKNFDGKVTVKTWSYEYYESGGLKTETQYQDS